MRREATPIQVLLWRTFTPAILVAAIALGGLVYKRLYDTILDGFSRKLSTTSSLTAGLLDPADHDGLIVAARTGAPPDKVEAEPRYVRNVVPMRRIRNELGLTFLYTQVLGPKSGVTYVLDANQDDDHSPPGMAGEPEAAMAGIRDATERGVLNVSPVHYEEGYGLLMSAAAPLRSADGRIAATVGADVSIKVIQVATQNALFASALVGLASLLACALMTLLILRRVAEPIEALKADALRIAAGDRNPPSLRVAPREVTRLREDLAELAIHLIARMRTAWDATNAQDRARNLKLLGDLLAEEPAVVTLVDDKDRLAVWIAPDDGAAEGRLRRRAMRALAGQIAAEPGLATDWAALADGALLAIDRKAKSATAVGDQPVVLQIGAAEVRLAPGESHALAAGAALAAIGPDGPAPLAWEAAR